MTERRVRIVIGSGCTSALTHTTDSKGPIEFQLSAGDRWIPPDGPMKFPPPPGKDDGSGGDGAGDSDENGGGAGGGQEGGGDGGDGGAKDGDKNGDGNQGSGGTSGGGGDGGQPGSGGGTGGGSAGRSGGGRAGSYNPPGQDQGGAKNSVNVAEIADAAYKAAESESDRSDGETVETDKRPVAMGASRAKERGYPPDLGYMVEFSLSVKDELNVYLKAPEAKVAVYVDEGEGEFFVKFPESGGSSPPESGGGTPTPPDGGGGTPTPPQSGGGTSTPRDKTPKGRIKRVKPGKGGWFVLAQGQVLASIGPVGHPIVEPGAEPALGAAWRSGGREALPGTPAPEANVSFGSGPVSEVSRQSVPMYYRSEAELLRRLIVRPSAEAAFSVEESLHAMRGGSAPGAQSNSDELRDPASRSVRDGTLGISGRFDVTPGGRRGSTQSAPSDLGHSKPGALEGPVDVAETAAHPTGLVKPSPNARREINTSVRQ